MSAIGNNEVKIGGNASDAQIAVGSYILQIGDLNGGVVNVAPPAASNKFERRTKHLDQKPRAFPSLLDRQAEAASLKSAINASTPVTLFGEAGIGKTSLLRSILTTEKFSSCTDGLIYLPVREQGLEDILQVLFDSFFSSGTNIKPSAGELRAELNKIQAAVVLDDVGLDRQDAMSLLDAMPRSIFVLASESRSLWGEGRVIPLGGLPKADALSLFTRELGRAPSKEDGPLIEQICSTLLGHPFRILETAALVREGKDLVELLNALQGLEPEFAATNVVLNSLDQPQKTILSILASLGGALVSLDHLRDLANVPNLENSLSGLSSLGLVQVDGSKFGVASSIMATLPRIMDLKPWDNLVIKHFANWLIQNPGQDLIEGAAEALAKALQKAGEQKEWPEVVRIGRALERILVVRKQWKAWDDILQLLLRAARALGDRKLEGWALHQLGSRAMCLGVGDSARELLSQALKIRKAIGDQAGIRLSQHNLNVLLKILPAPQSSGCRRWFTCSTIGVSGVLAAALLILAGYVATKPSPPPTILTKTHTPVVDHPTITPSFTPISTLTPTITPSPTITSTPTPLTLYDFVEHANEAEWKSYIYDPDGGTTVPIKFIGDPANIIPPDLMDQQHLAYAGWEKSPPVEDGSENSLVIDAFPFGGLNNLSGTFDLRWLKIERADQLVMRVGYRKNFLRKGFLNPAQSDGLKFVVFFEDLQSEKTFRLIEIFDQMDGLTHEQTIDLAKFAGLSGRFILQVEPLSTSDGDYALWMDAYLQRP